jgi:hypothetical protein
MGVRTGAARSIWYRSNRSARQRADPSSPPQEQSLNESRAVPVVQSASMRAPRWRSSVLLALALVASAATAAEDAQPVSVTIEWIGGDRCEFLLTKDAEGYGVVLKMDPIIPLAPGDVLLGKLSSINFTGRVVKEGTGQATMMRAMKYGARRKDAVNQIREWSRFCKLSADPPQ